MTIRKQPLPIIEWDGEKISKPGVYDMPIESYHGNCCVGLSISSSGLRTIESKSPAHYWDESYLNPKHVRGADSEAFTIGRAAHMLLLGETGFQDRFAIKPAEFKDFRSNAAKEWRDAQIAAGRSVLTHGDLETIRGMANALAAHPLIQSGLLNGEVERSLIWQDKETGVWLKSRPDALPVNADLITDLKTTKKADAASVRRSIAEYGYYMQLALVGMGMEAVLGRRPSDEDYVLVFVETSRPYCVNVTPIDPQAIYYGRLQVRRALRTFADCIERNEWPGYADDGATAGLPKYLIDRLEADIQSGLLQEVA